MLTDGEHLHRFCAEHRQLHHLVPMTKYFPHITFVLYCILFVSSILTLRQGIIKYQLSHYMWSIVTVCLVVFQCKFFGANILNGIFWFMFPICLVVSVYYGNYNPKTLHVFSSRFSMTPLPISLVYL